MWNKIVTFLVDNWQLLTSALLCLISLIVAIVRKRPAVNSVLQYIEAVITDELPSLIVYAEKNLNDGEDKKLWVLKQAMIALEKYIVLDENAKIKARNCFDTAIEMILSTPQKK